MKTKTKAQNLQGPEKRIVNTFEKKAAKSTSNTAILLVHSETADLHLKTAFNRDSSVEVHPDQPYHFASIGKTVTSAVIGLLFEQGLLDFGDLIEKYLDEGILSGLHIYKGVDYSRQITIRQLLNHTSGLADYYVDKNKAGISLADLMIREPERFWTPESTVEWTKKELNPRFAPGGGFHYSDTNYQLLGLIIQRITGLELHEAYRRFIFHPLGMKNSYLLFFEGPGEPSAYTMIDMFHEGVNLSTARSISMSWAGGGIVSTSEDMLRFHKALVKNHLLRKETLDRMFDLARMNPQIRYGYGIMVFHYPFMSRQYDLWGNSGSIGAFLYYNEALDLHMIGSFHRNNYNAPPFFFMMKVMKAVKKYGK